jgi:hypothetical protein
MDKPVPLKTNPAHPEYKEQLEDLDSRHWKSTIVYS